MKYLIVLLALLSGLTFGPCNSNEFDDVIILVGEKISVDQFDPEFAPDVILMDAAFKAKYRVLKVVRGAYDKDTIEFEAYDHYGTPDFSNYTQVLLFVARSGDKFFHLKYQFFPVYPTSSGTWASCAAPYSEDRMTKEKIIAPHPVTFLPEVSFDLAGLSRKEIKEYSKQHFAIRQGRAYCTTGEDLDDLVKIEMKGPLKDMDWGNIWLRFRVP